jgi:molybdopterin-guanine dinucleotide biosynthesis protein A
MRTAGFVLVGGSSSRMKRDKALLPWRNGKLVEVVADAVREGAGNVALVGRASLPEVPGLECLADFRPGLGPMAGIETALASGRGDLNLILACDLPSVRAEWLKQLVQTAQDRNSRCVVSIDVGGRVHPLCGVYRSDCLPAVQGALDKHRLRLIDLVAELGAEHLRVDGAIWNVNTPTDWQICQQDFANG